MVNDRGLGVNECGGPLEVSMESEGVVVQFLHYTPMSLIQHLAALTSFPLCL